MQALTFRLHKERNGQSGLCQANYVLGFVPWKTGICLHGDDIELGKIQEINIQDSSSLQLF